MSEYIYEVTKDSDGVDCYIKRGAVTRCKRCKHWTTIIVIGAETRICDAHKALIVTEADEFCSRAERREG